MSQIPGYKNIIAFTAYRIGMFTYLTAVSYRDYHILDQVDLDFKLLIGRRRGDQSGA